MATNLVILHPGRQIAAPVFVMPSIRATSTYPVVNVVMSDRNVIMKTGSEQQFMMDFDMLTASAMRNDYLFIQRADLMARAAQGTKIKMTQWASNSSDFGSSPERDHMKFSWDNNLVGPRDEDFIMETGSTASYRYYRVMSDPLPFDITWQVGAIYFGQWFDAGRDPDYNLAVSYDHNDSGERRARRTITLKWRNLEPSAKEEFQTYIDQYKNIAPVVLYDRNDYVFSGHKCIQCKVKNVNYNMLPLDKWNLTATFEEMI
jgi:hypothetical protein